MSYLFSIGSISPKKSEPAVTEPPGRSGPPGEQSSVKPPLPSSVFLETNEEEISNTGMMLRHCQYLKKKSVTCFDPVFNVKGKIIPYLYF